MSRSLLTLWRGAAVLIAVAVVATLVAGAVLKPPPAEAHAALIRANPANGEKVARSPLRVVLNFSEPLERKLTKIEVKDTQGNRVDQGDVQFDDNDAAFASIELEDLDPGLYLVSFDNVSTVDGHPWSGVTQFIVLNPDGTTPVGAEFDSTLGDSGGSTGLLPSALDSVLKWIALLSLATAAGAAFWMVVVAAPAASFMREDDERTASERAHSIFTLVAHTLLPLALVAAALLVAVTVLRFEKSTTIWEYFRTIRTGQFRLTLLILTLVALVCLDVSVFAKDRLLRSGALLAMLAASVGGLITYSFTSHGATGTGEFWAVTSDAVHLIASALWLGALVMLVPFMLWVRRNIGDPDRSLYTANVLDRFSIIAGMSIIAVLASGTFNALAQIPEWDALWETTYGRVLLVKLGLVVPLLAMGALNALVLKPRLVAAIDAVYQEGGERRDPPREDAPRRLAALERLLPRTILMEVVLAFAVFGSVAVLTQTSTAKGEIAQATAASQAGEGFRDSKTAGDLQLDIEITPNIVGLNRYMVTARNQDGTFATDITQMRLRFFYIDPTSPDAGTGQAEMLLQPFGDGIFRSSGAFFSQAGTWRVEANIRREGKDDVSRNFVSAVRPDESRGLRKPGRFALPFTSLGWNEVLGALIVIVGGTVMLYAAQVAPPLRATNRQVSTGGAAMALAGFVLMFVVSSGGQNANLGGNPVKPDEESLAAGRTLFQQNCIVCHGQNGRGDGPNAASLDPAPTDFRLHLPLHTDPQFFAFITNGVPGSAMPSWRDALSDTEVWNLVNYLRANFSEPVSADTAQ